MSAREIHFVPHHWAAYQYWRQQDRKTLRRINALIEAAARKPFSGLGKPEPLRGNLSGYWSRRIDETHRLVRRATDDALVIIACRFHYDRSRKRWRIPRWPRGGPTERSARPLANAEEISIARQALGVSPLSSPQLLENRATPAAASFGTMPAAKSGV